MKLFFDLDGTLTDPGEGITRCIQHALERLGRRLPPSEALERFIGPPLRASFAELLDTDDDALIEDAIAHYRERFSTVGMFENRVYPGVVAALEELRGAGHRSWVVTSKPRVYAIEILRHFGLDALFVAIFGSELSGQNAAKADLIRHVLHAEPSAAEGDPPWMVGDRRHDVEGAHANGLPAAGVLWGYGDEAELREAGADRLVASVAELRNWVTSRP